MLMPGRNVAGAREPQRVLAQEQQPSAMALPELTHAVAVENQLRAFESTAGNVLY
jgi:hypothetical protein